MQPTDADFKDDALNRVKFATNVSKFIESLDTGVVAIDGEWGSGKTWVGKRIRGLLDRDAQSQTVWIDTFEGDWNDDPVLSLLAAFAEQLPRDKRVAFVDAVAPLAGKVIASGAKTGLQMIGNLIGFEKSMLDDLSAAVKDSGDEFIKRKLNDLADRKKTFGAIHDQLAKSVEESSGKVIVFVDELDEAATRSK